MAHKTELDAVDRKILRLLATDGRSSYQALADEVGLSRPAVMERVKRLEEAGYITGYGARVDRAKAGFPVTAFVAVRYTKSDRSEEHTSELQSRLHLVCRLLLEKKKKKTAMYKLFCQYSIKRQLVNLYDLCVSYMTPS